MSDFEIILIFFSSCIIFFCYYCISLRATIIASVALFIGITVGFLFAITDPFSLVKVIGWGLFAFSISCLILWYFFIVSPDNISFKEQELSANQHYAECVHLVKTRVNSCFCSDEKIEELPKEIHYPVCPMCLDNTENLNIAILVCPKCGNSDCDCSISEDEYGDRNCPVCKNEYLISKPCLHVTSGLENGNIIPFSKWFEYNIKFPNMHNSFNPDSISEKVLTFKCTYIEGEREAHKHIKQSSSFFITIPDYYETFNDPLSGIFDMCCDLFDNLYDHIHAVKIYVNQLFIKNDIYGNKTEHTKLIEFLDIQKSEFTKINRDNFDISNLKKLFSQINESSDNNPSRVIPKSIKNEVWRRDQGKCVECNSNELLEFDHIIPISKGGSNTARNIQLLCQECNRKKSNKIG